MIGHRVLSNTKLDLECTYTWTEINKCTGEGRRPLKSMSLVWQNNNNMDYGSWRGLLIKKDISPVLVRRTHMSLLVPRFLKIKITCWIGSLHQITIFVQNDDTSNIVLLPGFYSYPCTDNDLWLLNHFCWLEEPVWTLTLSISFFLEISFCHTATT